MADDSYATIGLSGPAAESGVAGAEDPSLVEDNTQAISPFFIANGSTNLLANTLTGASYYVLNTAAMVFQMLALELKLCRSLQLVSYVERLTIWVFPLGWFRPNATYS